MAGSAGCRLGLEWLRYSRVLGTRVVIGIGDRIGCLRLGSAQGHPVSSDSLTAPSVPLSDLLHLSPRPHGTYSLVPGALSMFGKYFSIEPYLLSALLSLVILGQSY